MRRATVVAGEDTIATLKAEADRRGTSLATLLREAAEDKAAAIRSARRPRVGLGRSGDGLSARDLTSEPVAEAPG